MLSAVVGAQVRGVVVNQFDVAGKACARIGALNEIVAQQSIARKTMVENGMENRRLVNAFSCEDPLAVEILICI